MQHSDLDFLPSKWGELIEICDFVEGKLMETTCFFALCLIIFSFMNQGSPSSNTVLWMLVRKNQWFFQRCESPKPLGVFSCWSNGFTAGWCQETWPFHSFSDFQELSFLWFSLQKGNKRKKTSKNTWMQGFNAIKYYQQKTPVSNVCIYIYIDRYKNEK